MTQEIVPPQKDRQSMIAIRFNVLQKKTITEAFDCITESTARIFNASIALITLAASSLTENEKLDNLEFPQHSIANKHEHFDQLSEDNLNFMTLSSPWIAAEYGFKFFASAPILTLEQLRIGTLCIMDIRPRNFSIPDQSLLLGLSKLIIEVKQSYGYGVLTS